jgi:hypothetical protein
MQLGRDGKNINGLGAPIAGGLTGGFFPPGRNAIDFRPAIDFSIKGPGADNRANGCRLPTECA